MAALELHFLNARGSLADHVGWLGDALAETHRKAAVLMPLRPLDLVVTAGRWVIPEKGHVGHAPSPGIVYVTVDPDNDAFRANKDHSLERMFAHELHHAARWDGPGYGTSLGEALVSEGLAGHFARELFGGPPEPWELLPDDELSPHAAPAVEAWDDNSYDHGQWFFGKGHLPRWLGYSLGARLVGQYLDRHPDARASTLINADAGRFRTCLTTGAVRTAP